MINIFLFLSYYTINEHVSSESYFTVFSNLGYGFKKESFITLVINNSINEMIFGLATKDEIKYIESLGNDNYYCTGYDSLAEINYIFLSSVTGFVSLTIPTKRVLYPFSYECSGANDFTLSIHIENGKNSLDYRCQTAMIYSLVFSILYFVIGVSFLIYWIIYRKSEIFKFILIFSIIIFFGLEEILFYAYFVKNDKHEYFDTSNSRFYLRTAFIIFKFASLLLLSLYNSSLYNPFRSLLKIRKPFLIYWAISSIFLIIVIIFVIINEKSRLTKFFIPSIFYFLFIISQAILPNPISFTKIANIFYTLGNYFTFSMSSCYIQEMKAEKNAYLLIIDLNLASIIIQIITVALLLIGFIYNNNAANKVHEDENDHDLANKSDLSDQSFSSDTQK